MMQTGITREFNCKRLIAIGDVHGCFDLCKDLVENVIKFDPANDVLVFVGDYIDRGPKEWETVQYLCNLRAKHNERVFLLKGNHEDMAELALKTPIEKVPIYYQCLVYNEIATIESRYMYAWKANGASEWGENSNALLDFIDTLPLWLMTPDFLFVHAGCKENMPLEKQTTTDLLWDRYNHNGFCGRTVIAGHTPSKTIFEADGKIVIDTGAVFTSVLTGYDVLSKTIYQTRGKI